MVAPLLGAFEIEHGGVQRQCAAHCQNGHSRKPPVELTSRLTLLVRFKVRLPGNCVRAKAAVCSGVNLALELGRRVNAAHDGARAQGRIG